MAVLKRRNCGGDILRIAVTAAHKLFPLSVKSSLACQKNSASFFANAASVTRSFFSACGCGK